MLRSRPQVQQGGFIRLWAKHDAGMPQWLRELATLLESGIPPADALEKSSLNVLALGRQAQQRLRRGQSFSAVLGTTLLTRPADRVLLQAAEAGGFIPELLRKLAQEAEQRDRRLRQLKARFWILIFILGIIWLAGLVVVLFAAQSNFFSVVLRNTLVCGVFFGLLQFVKGLLLRDSWWWLNLLSRWGRLHQPMAQRIMAAQWLQVLGQQLGAGLDAAHSLKNMIGLVPDPTFKQKVRDAAASVERGRALSDSLFAAGLVSKSGLTGPLVAGEHSGALTDALSHAANLAEAELKNTVDDIVSTVPRVLYVIVCLIGVGIVL